MSDIETRLRLLSDRQAIEDLVWGYSRALDEERFDDWAACFTDDATLVYSWGNIVGTEGLAERIRDMLSPFGYMQHLISNLEVEFDGDTGRGRANFLVTLVRRDHPQAKYWQEGGYYHHAYRRTAAGWRLSRVESISKWWSPALRREARPDAQS